MVVTPDIWDVPNPAAPAAIVINTIVISRWCTTSDYNTICKYLASLVTWSCPNVTVTAYCRASLRPDHSSLHMLSPAGPSAAELSLVKQKTNTNQMSYRIKSK